MQITSNKTSYKIFFKTVSTTIETKSINIQHIWTKMNIFEQTPFVPHCIISIWSSSIIGNHTAYRGIEYELLFHWTSKILRLIATCHRKVVQRKFWKKQSLCLTQTPLPPHYCRYIGCVWQIRQPELGNLVSLSVMLSGNVLQFWHGGLTAP